MTPRFLNLLRRIPDSFFRFDMVVVRCAIVVEQLRPVCSRNQIDFFVAVVVTLVWLIGYVRPDLNLCARAQCSQAGIRLCVSLVVYKF